MSFIDRVVPNSLNTQGISSGNNNTKTDNNKTDPKSIRLFNPVRYNREIWKLLDEESTYCNGNPENKPSNKELQKKYNLTVDERLYENFEEITDEDGNKGFKLRLFDGTEMQYLSKDGKLPQGASVTGDIETGIKYQGFDGSDGNLRIFSGYCQEINMEKCNDFDYLPRFANQSDKFNLEDTSNVTFLLEGGNDEITVDDKSQDNIFIKTGDTLKGIAEGDFKGKNYSIIDTNLDGTDDRIQDRYNKYERHVLKDSADILRKSKFQKENIESD